MSDRLRQLPQVQSLLEAAPAQALMARFSRDEVVEQVRTVLQEVRDGLRVDPKRPLPDFFAEPFFDGLAARIRFARRSLLTRVINATGIVIHTNLGRAPLAPEAFAAMQAAAAGYSNLELDLDTGKRGSRYQLVEGLLCELTGAEAAIVVNNCAAAVLVSLSALAAGGDVVASRGEMIEIGGSFRLPDVIRQSGARLVEIGATNKTRLSDYEQAVSDTTRVFLKSHTSNYRIVGFTATPDRKDIATLAHAHDLVFMEDLGSGVLVDLAPYGLVDEPVVSDILKTGVDLVAFSGDKLLGGPQAGMIAGRKSVIDQLKSHPLLRAVRIDKLSLAALEATLRLYKPPHNPFHKIPVLEALAQDTASIRARAEDLTALIKAHTPLNAETQSSIARAGGGSLPQQDLESFAVVVTPPTGSPEALAAGLRRSTPPVIGRIAEDRLHLDMRTVTNADLPDILTALRQAVP